MYKYLPYTVQFSIIGIKPVSTNDMYFATPMKSKTKTYKNGEPRLITRKVRTPELKKYQESMSTELSIKVKQEDVDKLKELTKSGHIGLSLSLSIGMPLENYEDSDASNYIKALEDCISNRLGIDDSNNPRITVDKYVSNSSMWEQSVVITTIPKDSLYRIKRLNAKIEIDRCPICGELFSDKVTDKDVVLCDNCKSSCQYCE